mmetsp:Transcript_60328/g.93839  ORF Transcript_60328/g.93839 Transcript_60328/m.93839 type:complete len:234 (-) Transcript_60328:8-709(-)
MSPAASKSGCGGPAGEGAATAPSTKCFNAPNWLSATEECRLINASALCTFRLANNMAGSVALSADCKVFNAASIAEMVPLRSASSSWYSLFSFSRVSSAFLLEASASAICVVKASISVSKDSFCLVLPAIKSLSSAIFSFSSAIASFNVSMEVEHQYVNFWYATSSCLPSTIAFALRPCNIFMTFEIGCPSELATAPALAEVVKLGLKKQANAKVSFIDTVGKSIKLNFDFLP